MIKMLFSLPDIFTVSPGQALGGIFEDIHNALVSFLNLIVDLVDSLLHIGDLLNSVADILSDIIDVMPPWLQVFITASIAISVVYQLVGRSQ